MTVDVRRYALDDQLQALAEDLGRLFRRIDPDSCDAVLQDRVVGRIESIDAMIAPTASELAQTMPIEEALKLTDQRSEGLKRRLGEGSRPRPATSSRPRPQVTSSFVPTPYGGDEDEHLVPDLVPDPSIDPSETGLSWRPIDLVAREAEPPRAPEIIDLLYPKLNHLVSGETESAKSWLAAAAAAGELEAGQGVLWIDGDDVGGGAMLERLRALGVNDEAIGRLFGYVAPEEHLTEERRADLLERMQADSCRLVVFDGFNPLLQLHRLNPNEGTDVEAFYRHIDPFRKTGAASVLTDNVVKNREARGRWAIGSERKKSKAEVHLGMHALVTLVRGGTGRFRIDVHKDRPGHLQRPTAGIFVLESDGDACTWRIDPDQSYNPEGEFRPTNLMEKVSRLLERQLEAVSRNQIEQAKLGKAEYVRVAIDCLIAEGYAVEIPGARSAKLVQLRRPFVEAEDEAT
jgi:hypothetical protein